MTAAPQTDPHPALSMRRDLEDRAAVAARYARVRGETVKLTARLTPEDMQVQSMPDVSPTKWHLAHVSWFFETFLLGKYLSGYEEFHPQYNYLFNSYYEAKGQRWSRPHRGLLSRPGLDEVMAYRAHVDEGMAKLIDTLTGAEWAAAAPLVELGLHHEQQHQELTCTDIKHVLDLSPLDPACFAPRLRQVAADVGPAAWVSFDGGLVETGASDPGFVYDNELPRHKRWLEPFALSDRLVTNGEWLAFMEDGGYDEAALWLSDGWAKVQGEGWRAPLYWRRDEDGGWSEFTLHGLEPLDTAAPVTHVSGFEAAAYAAWTGYRLPKEEELELAQTAAGPRGALLFEAAEVHPYPAGPSETGRLRQMTGDVWEWTCSPYTPYPGYRAPEGAVGEYNGKFMSSQLVLRGGSCATPYDHIRPTYRNFFYPDSRWQFSGLRLARDL